MDRQNRSARRAAAKANGVRGQLYAGLVVVPQPVTSVTLAGAILGAIEGVERQGGAPLERSAITIGSDHPEHPGEVVVEVKTDRRARVAGGSVHVAPVGTQLPTEPGEPERPFRTLGYDEVRIGGTGGA